MTQTNRRTFLGTATAAGASLAMVHGAPAAAMGEDNERALKMGVIGVGGYGMADAKAALKVGGVEITAICDVDQEHLDKNAAALEQLQGKRPETFKQYETMLDQARLDVAVIATPPHWHTLQLLACLQAGLDVYCEKPLSYDIREGRACVQAVRESDRIVQVGFQRRQSQAFRQAGEFVRAGKAGTIVQADVQIHYRAGTKDPTPQDPPASLDWDLWCGPGPRIPYSPQVGHRNWRLEQTSGHGHLVDWGIHNIDATRMMLGLDVPEQITAAGGIFHYQGIITTPDTLCVQFEYDQLPVVWRHRLWGATEYNPEVNNGVFLFGTEATVFVADRKWVVIPKASPGDRKEHELPSDMGRDHMANFLDCVRTRKQPDCPIETAYQTTKTVQLGMIAYESNSVVRWDEAGECIVDNPDAAKLVKREYRQPYTHPYTA